MLLSVQNLDVFYGVIQALHGVSLHIDRGEIVTLIGANGAGKTTLLRTISGLIQPAQGSIRWNPHGEPAPAPAAPSAAPAPTDPPVLGYRSAPAGPLYGMSADAAPTTPTQASTVPDHAG